LVYRVRANRGFALIVVLWALVLIGFIIAHLTANGRTEIMIARNLAANATAQAAADGAIYQAIFNLLNPDPATRWPIDGTPREIRVGDSRIVLRIEDEGGRINPSVASPELMAALLQVVGVDPDTARGLAEAIGVWVGNGSAIRRTPEQTAAEYRAAGLDYGPPGEPLQTLGELSRVLGMTPEILAAIRPHLTLYAVAEPDPAHAADPVIATALALLARRATGPPRIAETDQLQMATVRITATAYGPGNAELDRVVVARVGPTLAGGYTILARGGGID
jgi:general secretion pathway protein K